MSAVRVHQHRPAVKKSTRPATAVLVVAVALALASCSSTARTGTVTGFLALNGGPTVTTVVHGVTMRVQACEPEPPNCLQPGTITFTKGASARRVHTTLKGFRVQLAPGTYKVTSPCGPPQRIVVRSDTTVTADFYCRIP